MRRLKNKCLGIFVMSSLLASTNLIASPYKPELKLHQEGITSSKVTLDLAMKGLGENIVALEIGLVADDIKDVEKIDWQVEGENYRTYKLTKLADGTEELILYVVGEDRLAPIPLKEGILNAAHLTLQTSGKLKISEDKLYVKVIEKDYLTSTFVPTFVYTEGSFPQTPSGGGSSSSGSSNSENSNHTENVDKEENVDSTVQTPEQDLQVQFTDVEAHWAKNAIYNMAKRGIIKGYEDGSFKPSASITRGEFASLLASAFKLEGKNTVSPFKDVSENKWYTQSVVALYEAGITSGRPDGTFGVRDTITNEEMSTMLYRALDVLNIELTQVRDEALNFVDSDKISPYAKEAVQELSKKGIINGQPDGSFIPKSATSRAQVAVMLDKVFESMK